MHRRRIVAQNRGQRVDRRGPLEGAAPGEHLVEHGAERELIGAKIHDGAARLFRRHVGQRAHHGARPRIARARHGFAVRVAARQSCQAEVEYLGEAVVGDHHVLGLEIAMDDAGLVGFRKPVGDLCGNRECAAQRQRPALERLAERLAGDQLHADPRLRRLGADVIDGDDGRMVERGGGARFALEASEAFGVAGDVRREQFQRDKPIEPRVARLVDLAHSACPKRSDDFIGSESSACGDAHHSMRA